jgi:hypothetical protein
MCLAVGITVSKYKIPSIADIATLRIVGVAYFLKNKITRYSYLSTKLLRSDVKRYMVVGIF